MLSLKSKFLIIFSVVALCFAAILSCFSVSAFGDEINSVVDDAQITDSAINQFDFYNSNDEVAVFGTDYSFDVENNKIIVNADNMKIVGKTLNQIEVSVEVSQKEKVSALTLENVFLCNSNNNGVVDLGTLTDNDFRLTFNGKCSLANDYKAKNSSCRPAELITANLINSNLTIYGNKNTDLTLDNRCDGAIYSADCNKGDNTINILGDMHITGFNEDWCFSRLKNCNLIFGDNVRMELTGKDGIAFHVTDGNVTIKDNAQISIGACELGINLRKTEDDEQKTLSVLDSASLRISSEKNSLNLDNSDLFVNTKGEFCLISKGLEHSNAICCKHDNGNNESSEIKYINLLNGDIYLSGKIDSDYKYSYGPLETCHGLHINDLSEIFDIYGSPDFLAPKETVSLPVQIKQLPSTIGYYGFMYVNDCSETLTQNGYQGNATLLPSTVYLKKKTAPTTIFGNGKDDEDETTPKDNNDNGEGTEPDNGKGEGEGSDIKSDSEEEGTKPKDDNGEEEGSDVKSGSDEEGTKPKDDNGEEEGPKSKDGLSDTLGNSNKDNENPTDGESDVNANTANINNASDCTQFASTTQAQNQNINTENMEVSTVSSVNDAPATGDFNFAIVAALLLMMGVSGFAIKKSIQ